MEIFQGGESPAIKFNNFKGSAPNLHLKKLAAHIAGDFYIFLQSHNPLQKTQWNILLPTPLGAYTKTAFGYYMFLPIPIALPRQ